MTTTQEATNLPTTVVTIKTEETIALVAADPLMVEVTAAREEITSPRTPPLLINQIGILAAATATMEDPPRTTTTPGAMVGQAAAAETIEVEAVLITTAAPTNKGITKGRWFLFFLGARNFGGFATSSRFLDLLSRLIII